MENEDTVASRLDAGDSMRMGVQAQQQVLWGTHAVLSDWMVR